MINGFERETAPLTDYEKDTLLPLLVRGLSSKIGKNMAVSNKYIVSRLIKQGYKIDEARVRKIINHIRLKGLVPCLVATSAGYYIATDEEELREYIESLRGRESAIRAVREAIEEQAQTSNTIICDDGLFSQSSYSQ